MSGLYLLAADEAIVTQIVLLVSIPTVILLVIFVVFVKHYRRCPSNRVLVVFGRVDPGKAAVCVHGGARLVLPVIQDYRWLSLEPLQIEITLKGVPSKDDVCVSLPSVFTVAIGTTPELMQNAAIRLLDLSFQEIHKHAEEIVIGQLRQVIASMDVKDIDRDRNQFMKNIEASVEPALKEIGLVLISVNIADESGYIEAAGDRGKTAAVEKVVTAALLRKLLAAFDVSAPRLIAHLMEEGKLNEGDREEIRQLLNQCSSSP